MNLWGIPTTWGVNKFLDYAYKQLLVPNSPLDQAITATAKQFPEIATVSEHLTTLIQHPDVQSKLNGLLQIDDPDLREWAQMTVEAGLFVVTEKAEEILREFITQLRQIFQEQSPTYSAVLEHYRENKNDFTNLTRKLELLSQQLAVSHPSNFDEGGLRLASALGVGGRIPFTATVIPQDILPWWQQACMAMQHRDIKRGRAWMLRLRTYLHREKLSQAQHQELAAAVDVLDGLLAWLAGNPRDAVLALERAHVRCPDEDQLVMWIGRIKLSQNTATAQELLPLAHALVETRPSPDARDWLAILYVVNGDLSEAESTLGSPNTFPWHAEVEKTWSVMRFRQKAYRAARHHAIRALQLAPEDPEAFFNLAQIVRADILQQIDTAPYSPLSHAHQRKLRIAIWAFTHAVERFSAPSDTRFRIQALIGKAHCLRLMNHPERATLLLEAIAESDLDADSSKVREQELAVCYGMRGDMERAITHWRNCLDKADESERSAIELSLGMSLLFSEDFQEALAAIQRIDEQQLTAPQRSQWTLIHLYADLVKGQRSRVEIVAEFEHLMEVDLQFAPLVAGDFYLRAESWDRALQVASSAAQQEPANVLAHLGQAYALAQLGQTAKAYGIIQTLEPMALSVSQRIWLHQLGLSLAGQLRDWAATIQYASTLLAEPIAKEPALWGARGRAYYAVHDWDNAARDLTQYIEQTADWSLGSEAVEAFLRKGRWTEALHWVHLAHEAAPQAVWPWIRRVQIYLFQGRQQDALVLVTSLRDRFPNDPFVSDLHRALTMEVPAMPPMVGPLGTATESVYRRAVMHNMPLPYLARWYLDPTNLARELLTITLADATQFLERRSGIVVDPVALMLVYMCGLAEPAQALFQRLHVPYVFQDQLVYSIMRLPSWDLPEFLQWCLEWDSSLLFWETITPHARWLVEPITDACMHLAREKNYPLLVAEQTVADEARKHQVQPISLVTFLDEAKAQGLLTQETWDHCSVRLIALSCNNVPITPNGVLVAAQQTQWNKDHPLLRRVLQEPASHLGTSSVVEYSRWLAILWAHAPNSDVGLTVCRELIVALRSNLRTPQSVNGLIQSLREHLPGENLDALIRIIRIVAL
ncbi:MAG: hypothetical protein C7B44_02035 [Sulfobacillus thermosulfidooxidans]|nr:MAG: hypothetical protein C7B44_02035 [Sulfobacillus thermosulfidooxidans]